MQAMRLRMMLLAINAAHVAVSFLHTKLQGIQMNLSDRLKQIGDIIATGAPHLAAAVAEAETLVTDMAPLVVASIPSAATVATEVASVVGTVQDVTAAVAAVVTTPVADIATALAGTPDEQAGVAAAASVSAQATATPAAHETRLQILESTMVELLPAVAAILKMFGK